MANISVKNDNGLSFLPTGIWHYNPGQGTYDYSPFAKLPGFFGRETGRESIPYLSPVLFLGSLAFFPFLGNQECHFQTLLIVEARVTITFVI